MTEPLADFRVVEFASGLAPAYAGKLYADAGAEVWLVEPEDGDPLRRWSASGNRPGNQDGALWRFLAGSKRSVVGRLGDEVVDQLLDGADVVLEALPAGTVESQGLTDRPGLVVASISPYGRSSWAGRPASEMTVQAVSGSLMARLYPEGALQAGGRISEWASGAYAAAASLAAAQYARSSGRGTHIDLSQAEVMCICTNLFLDLMWDLLDRPDIGEMGASTEFPAIERCADGWVGFNTNSAQMFEDFLVMVERTDLAGDPTLRNDAIRRQGLEATTTEWCRGRTAEEITELAALLRIPAVPVGNGENLPRNTHLQEREAFGRTEDGLVYPRPPYKLNGRRRPPLGAAPALAADQRAAKPKARRAPDAAPVDGAPRPLAGLKVLDMTCWWAGPGATQLMAGLGADVIHVEAIQRMDGMRPAATLIFTDRDQWWEYSPFFLTINVNKKDITLDLEQPEGRDLAAQLMAWADVIIENYTPRVMEHFGYDARGLLALNPKAVVVRMPAFGLDGPWRDRVGFAQTMEAMCGMAWITGDPSGPPRLPRGPCDPIGAMHGAFATLVALEQARAEGVGQTVEAALLESGLNVAAEQVLEHSAYGFLLERKANHSPGVAPQGVYGCADGARLALTVTDDAQWAGLREAIGSPAWAADEALLSLEGRSAAAEQLDQRLAEWAAGQDSEAACDLLLRNGVPAAVAADFRNVSRHPLFIERGFFEVCDHPVVGERPMFGMPFHWSGIDRWIHSPAPTIGQHNGEVLTSILGLGPEELRDLEARQVIGTRPLGI